MRQYNIISALALVLAASAAVQAGNPAKQSSYLIKSRTVTSSAEALTILRRFMPIKLKADERCEKYAVMLNLITRSHLDQFKLAEIGLEAPEVTRKEFREIDVETLRQLYMDGIGAFREGGPSGLDASVLDLVECLSKKFRTLDAKARSFLNQPQLQEMLRQYNSLMGQKLSFLLDAEAKHPDLSYERLEPAVRATVNNLFAQDLARARSHFPGPAAGQPEQQQVAAAPAEQAASSEPAPVVVQPPQAAPVEPHPLERPEVAHQPEKAKASESESETLDGDEMELLNRVIGSLHEMYNKLPVESKLGDRCAAYGKVIQADTEHLSAPGGQLVDEVVQEVARRLATSGPSSDTYKPDENARENFIFILGSFPREEVGHETWIDLVDCVSEWVDIDPKVQEFINSPEQAQILEELMRAPEVPAASLLAGSAPDSPAAAAAASASATAAASGKPQ